MKWRNEGAISTGNIPAKSLYHQLMLTSITYGPVIRVASNIQRAVTDIFLPVRATTFCEMEQHLPSPMS